MARVDLFAKIPLIGMSLVFLAMFIVAVTAYLHAGWYSIIGYAIAAVVAVCGFVMTFRDVRDTPGPPEQWDARGNPVDPASPGNLTRARTGSMTTEPKPSTYDNSALLAEDEGYHKGLKPRQLQMIAIGGAIGTGLFLGAGGRLHNAGPGLFLSYAFCGIFVFLILRALGELVLHRPSSGSFVSYAREFLGEKAAFVAGWMYWLNWAFTAIVDSTAIATYFHYWTSFGSVPQWLIALLALAAVVSVNLISVTLFGELEFWAAAIKVLALMTFLVAGTIFLAGRYQIQGQSTGFSVIADNGGLFPAGLFPLVIVMSGVVFAYAAVELVGTAAGETAHPHKIMPRAINSVIARIAVFYVGSLFLLALLLPYTTYKAGESPFVTFFSKIGVEGAGTVMNIVVLTAAFSSLNAGLYSTGRILRSMAMNGSAPKFTARMSSRGVPYGGIFLTAVVGLFGVILNLLVPRPGVRDRAQHRGPRHHRVLGHHRHLSDPALPLVETRHPGAAVIPVVGHAVHRLSHVGVPVRRRRADGTRPADRHLDRRQPGDHHSGPHRRLVCGPRAGAGGRSGTPGLHRPIPGRRQPPAATRQG